MSKQEAGNREHGARSTSVVLFSDSCFLFPITFMGGYSG